MILMIILKDKAYCGKDIIMYSIHHNGLKEVEDGAVYVSIIPNLGAKVVIELYEDNETWPKGPHHYLNEIIDVLKVAEKDLPRIIDLEIEKVNYDI